MTTYLYKVKDADGGVFWGIAEAKNIKELKKQLRSNDYFFISATVFDSRNLSKIKFKLDDLLMFTHRLSYLIEAGVPIIQSLNIIWKQSEQKDLQIVVSYVRKKLEEGATLQEALNYFPNVFPPMYLALIGVAEIGAGLVRILRKLNEYLESQKAFDQRVQKATIYPSFVLGFALLVVIGLFVFVVPTFEKVIVKLHGELPIITKVLFGFSTLLRNPFFIGFVVLSAIIGSFLWVYFKKFDKFVYWLDSWKLKAPFLKKVLFPLVVGRLTRSLGLLIASGVPLLVALEVSKKTIGNKRIETAIDQIKRQIAEGGSLFDAFKSTKAFPVILVDIMGIGESSGKLHEMLEKISFYFEEEADHALVKFLTFLEPMLIITVGAIVLTVLLGIYLPIFSIQNTLRAM